MFADFGKKVFRILLYLKYAQLKFNHRAQICFAGEDASGNVDPVPKIEQIPGQNSRICFVIYLTIFLCSFYLFIKKAFQFQQILFGFIFRSLSMFVSSAKTFPAKHPFLCSAGEHSANCKNINLISSKGCVLVFKVLLNSAKVLAPYNLNVSTNNSFLLLNAR